MEPIDEYLGSLDSEILIGMKSIQYIDEVKKFFKENKSRLDELPSTSQFEELKLKNNLEDLIKYIIHQSERATNKKWRTMVFYNNRYCPFFEFFIERVYSITSNAPELVKYFIEYFTDFLKMNRKWQEQ